jgi:hypothetical protein
MPFVAPYAESLDGEDALTIKMEPPINLTKHNRQAHGHLTRAFGTAMALLRRYYQERKSLSRAHCCNKNTSMTRRDWHRGMGMLEASGVMVKTVGHSGGRYFPLEYRMAVVRLNEFRKDVVILLNADYDIDFLS